MTDEIVGCVLSSVASEEGPVQAAELLAAASAEVAEASEAILTEPVPVHPLIVIVAVLAAPWAMLLLQPAVAVPPRVTLLEVVTTVTLPS